MSALQPWGARRESKGIHSEQLRPQHQPHWELLITASTVPAPTFWEICPNAWNGFLKLCCQSQNIIHWDVKTKIHFFISTKREPRSLALTVQLTTRGLNRQFTSYLIFYSWGLIQTERNICIRRFRAVSCKLFFYTIYYISAFRKENHDTCLSFMFLTPGVVNTLSMSWVYTGLPAVNQWNLDSYPYRWPYPHSVYNSCLGRMS